MRIRKSLGLGALILGSAIFTVNSCGGGGGGSVSTGDMPSSSPSYSKLAVFITDDISTQFDEAWVKIYRVTITDSNGNVHELFSDPNGKVVNLFELSNVAELLNIAVLPPGAYSNLQVQLDSQVVLIDKTGNAINASLSSNTLEVGGFLNLQEGVTSSIGIDFDLKQFNYDPTTGTVQPVAIFKPEDEIESVQEHKAKLEGIVVGIIDSNTLEVRLENGSTVTVSLGQGATVYSNGTVYSDTSGLSEGMEVYISGNFDPNTSTISATSLYIDSSDEDDSPSTPPAGGTTGSRVEVEGRIVSVSNNQIVIDVSEAEGFVPGTETITIDISAAEFLKGSIDSLQEGVKIEVYGTLGDDGSISATVVEIEDGNSGDNHNGNGNDNDNSNDNSNDNNNDNDNDNDNSNDNDNDNDNGNNNDNDNDNDNTNSTP